MKKSRVPSPAFRAFAPDALDACAQTAYSTFLENVREYAPPLAAVQPEWDEVPEVMKQAWRNAVEAALVLSRREPASRETKQTSSGLGTRNSEL